MKRNAIARTIAEIAERERAEAISEGDYVWALICALVQQRSREVAESG